MTDYRITLTVVVDAESTIEADEQGRILLREFAAKNAVEIENVATGQRYESEPSTLLEIAPLNDNVVTRHTLTAAQAAHVTHWNGYGVPVQWFVGAEHDDGSVEVLALGNDEDNGDFVWSLLINKDGTECHTTEASIPDGFETGITI